MWSCRVLVAALCLSACSTPPPRAAATAPPAPAPAAPAAPVDVVLLPVGDFPVELAGELAKRLSPDVKLVVRASLPMGTRDIQPIPPGTQYAADDIVARAHEVAARLPGRNDSSIVIALTTFDINERSGPLRFVFAKNDPNARTSVLSVARLGYSTPKAQATRAQLLARIYKMTKRAIGEQYFGLQRSSDLRDIMYSPIMSLEDIDAMGSEYVKRAPPPSAEQALAAPPAGYAWRRIPELRAAILVPTGWHFREEKQGKTHAVFVTEDEFGADLFEVGVTLNAFVGNPSAPTQLQQALSSLAAKHSVELAAGKQGSFATLRCEFDDSRDGGKEAIHAFHLAIANTRTRTSYLATFEAPVSRWPAASKQGLTILDHLALETEL